jgi:hypothetical protein
LLTKARTPKTPEHDRILHLLHKREAETARTRAARPPRPQPQEEQGQQEVKEEKKERPRYPILTNIAAPGEPPQFVGRPRPQSEFPGKPRRIPSLAAVSEGFPFLRYTKPQPEALTRLISRKRSRWIKTMDGLLHAEEEAAPWAALEDQWDDLVMKQMEREQGRGASLEGSGLSERKPEDHTETYLYSTVMSRLWHEYRLDKMWEEWNARGKALYDLLKAERALAEEEGTQPRDQRLGSAPTLEETDAAAAAASSQRATPTSARGSVIPVNRALPCVEEGMRLTKEFAGHPSMYDQTHDPFTTPIWEGIVKHQHRRLVKWMGLTQHWNQDFVENPGPDLYSSNHSQRGKRQHSSREDRRSRS